MDGYATWTHLPHRTSSAQPAPPFSSTSHSLTRTLSPSPSSHFQLGFIVPLVIFDCTAFTLTFLGLSTPGESMLIGVAPLLPRTSISARVLRDGLFYFLILCMVNISWAISSSFLDVSLSREPLCHVSVVLMLRVCAEARFSEHRTSVRSFYPRVSIRPVR